MNLIIVDDEPIIRKGLRTLVDWESNGFRLVGEAEDGFDALELVRNHQVDIIITDLLMPRMDGLELIRQLKELQEDSSVLVLSCLDDFNYVKEAMKLGASDYILKPTMETDQLLIVLKEMKLKLEKQRLTRKQWLASQEEWKQSKQMQLSQRLQAYIRNGIWDEQLNLQLFPVGHKLFAVALVQQEQSLSKPFEWNMLGLSAYAELENQHVMLLFSCNQGLSVQEEFALRSAKVNEVLHTYKTYNQSSTPHDDFVISASPILSQMNDLHQLYAWIDKLLYYRFYHSTEHVILDPPLLTMSEESIALEIRNDLLRALSHGNVNAVQYQTLALKQYLEKVKPSIARVKRYVFELLGLAVGLLRDKESRHLNHYEEKIKSVERTQTFLRLGGLLQWLLEALTELQHIRWGNVNDSDQEHPFVRKARLFMRDNYQRSLGTVDIAAHLKLSRSYLSDLFSRETGQSLSEELNNIRIRQAKQLLRQENLKIYEIAEAVGFTDAKSFTKVFKRIEGMTPREYETHNR
jgi:two-component system response regulator YesN